MKRRAFITLLGGVAALPLVAHAQQAAMPMVGFLRSIALSDTMVLESAFRQGLKDAGFIDGQNVAVEYYSAEGQPDRMRDLVADLINRRVAVIAGNAIAMVAAKAATTTIPIVFAGGADPIRLGLVASLNRPGGNVTGVSFFGGSLGTKRLELLRQLVPKATAIAVLINPNTIETEAERRDVEAAAQTLGQQLVILDVGSTSDIEAAFPAFLQRGAGALLVGSGPFLSSHRELVVTLAARHVLPASYSSRQSAEVGGLMSYGTSQPDAYRQAGVYTGRILKGEKPADLPVMRATKFDLVLNLKAARALGLDVPDRMLALADEVIE